MKQNISDLLDAYSGDEIVLNMETPLSAERIKIRTMDTIKEQRKPRKRRMTFRVMMAAAIIVTLAMTVFAAGSAAGWFQSFFADENRTGLTEEQMALIEQSAVLVDQSQTVEGYTIHVASVMNDARTVYVKLDLRAPEGTVLPYGDNRCFEGLALYSHGGEQVNVGWAIEETIDADKTDNHDEILLNFEMDPDVDLDALLAEGFVLELTDLTKTTGSFFSQKKEIMAAGCWRFDLIFGADQEELWSHEVIGQPVPCAMVKYHTGEETEIILTSICLRALTVDVFYDYPDGADLEPLDWMGMKLIKTDGTAMRLLPSGGSFGPDGDRIIGYMTLEPSAPIVPEEAAAIEFPGGTRIPVNAEA